MDIKSTAIYLSNDMEFTDSFGKRHTVRYTSYQEGTGGLYVHAHGQGYPEFYLQDHAVIIHVPDAKFKPGDSVIARNGRGAVYMINKVAKDYAGRVYYIFDNGSVDVRKRARSGRHYAADADKGYKKLLADAVAVTAPMR